MYHMYTVQYSTVLYCKEISLGSKALQILTILYCTPVHLGEAVLLHWPVSVPGVADSHSNRLSPPAGEDPIPGDVASSYRWHIGSHRSFTFHMCTCTCICDNFYNDHIAVTNFFIVVIFSKTMSTSTTKMVQSPIYSTPSFPSSTTINLTPVATECKLRTSSTHQ